MPWTRGGGGRGGGGGGSGASTLPPQSPPPPPPPPPSLVDPTEPSKAELWSDAETHVRVDRLQGFLCRVSVHAKIDLPPAGVFAILTQPDNSGVFRSLVAMPYRRVLASDPGTPGKRSVEVEHVARWRAGPLLTGTLSTRLVVDEDPGEGTVAFRLAPGGRSGFMSSFEGAWRVAPFGQGALDEALAAGGGGGGGGAAPPAAAPPPPPAEEEASRLTYTWPWGVAGAALARVGEALPSFPSGGGRRRGGGDDGGRGGGGGGGGGRSSSPARHHRRGRSLPTTGASLVTLSQSVGPRLHIPPPIDRLVTAICARQVKGLLSDLRAEAARRRHRAAGDWADAGLGVQQQQREEEWGVAAEARRKGGRAGRGAGQQRALLW